MFFTQKRRQIQETRLSRIARTRRLAIETLERRELLTAQLSLTAPPAAQTGIGVIVPAEVRNLVPGGAEGEGSSTPLAARLGKVVLSFQGDVSISTITDTSFVNGFVYTVGWNNSNQGLAIEWDLQTGQGREIHMNDPSTLTGGLGGFSCSSP